MPRMLGLEGRHIHQSSAGWIPVYLDSRSQETRGVLACMSIGFLLRDRGDSVVWRGPKKGSMINQFVEDVVWGDLDYLLIDTPPGFNASRGNHHVLTTQARPTSTLRSWKSCETITPMARS